MKFSHLGRQCFPPRAKNYITKIPNTQHEKLPYKLLVKGVQVTPKHYRLLLLPSVLPEMEGKLLLLMIPYTSDTEPGGLKN